MAGPRSRPMTPFQERLARVAVQCMSGLNNAVYRLSVGRVGGRLPSGGSVCLLTTIGRRTGRPRTVPLLYVEDGADLVVVASRGGMGSHPAWYLNILATPDVVVQTGAMKRTALARPADAADAVRLWPTLVAAYEHFDEYQARTDRQIPVVVLSPQED